MTCFLIDADIPDHFPIQLTNINTAPLVDNSSSTCVSSGPLMIYILSVDAAINQCPQPPTIQVNLTGHNLVCDHIDVQAISSITYHYGYNKCGFDDIKIKYKVCTQVESADMCSYLCDCSVECEVIHIKTERSTLCELTVGPA